MRKPTLVSPPHEGGVYCLASTAPSNEIYRFPGNDSRLHTQVGMRFGTVVSSGQEGCLVYGPHLELPAGQYRVLIYGTMDKTGGDGTYADVVVDKAVRLLALSTALGSSGVEGILADLLITLDTPCTDLETRVWVQAHSKVTVSLVEIQPWFAMEENGDTPPLIDMNSSIAHHGDSFPSERAEKAGSNSMSTAVAVDVPPISQNGTTQGLAVASRKSETKMVSLENVTKQYNTRQGVRTVLDCINLQVVKGEKIGILGRNGAGKSTLIRLISGAELPTCGHIHRSLSVSWPLAFSGAFQGSLTGLDNLRFICRVYDADIESAIPLVEEFSELGAYLREPVKTYSSGMRARLAFAISMAVEFDCFLIDEIIAVGDSRFHEKCQFELFEKRNDRAMILVSHSAEYVREHCQRAAVLVTGKLYPFESVDEALAYYNEHAGE